MKSKLSLLFGIFILIIIQLQVNAQANIPKGWTETPYIFEEKYKNIFDIVFPGVDFVRLKDNNSIGNSLGRIYARYNTKRFEMVKDINKLLYMLEKTGKPPTYAPALLIQSFIYLNFLNESNERYQFSIDNINIEKLDSSENGFNYRVKVLFKEGSNNLFWVRAEIYILVEKNEIISATGKETSKTGKIIEMDFSCCKSIKSLSPEQLENYLKSESTKGQDKSILYYDKITPVEGIGVVDKVEDLANAIDYYYLRTRENNNPTGNGKNFLISGLNPIHNNLVLKIYSSPPGFSHLLYSAPIIPVGGGLSGKTQVPFFPSDDCFDGFCQFQIWDNNVLIKTFDNTFLVLEKVKTGNFPNSTEQYVIHYCCSFFANLSTCNDYITKVETYTKSAWNNQVNSWGFCSDLSPQIPSNSNPTYDISVNSGKHDYPFWFDFTYRHCYAIIGSFRHIGIVATPAIMLEETEYSNDEFMEVELAHEFLHGIQFSYKPAPMDDKLSWLLEGQARFIQTVTNPNAEFYKKGDYKIDANTFLKYHDESLTFLSYSYCLFWRFLFESYDPSPNIADKLRIIWQTQSCPNSDIPTVESFLDQKLQGSIETMDDAIKIFAKKMYFNNLTSNWNPNPTGFYNPPSIESNITYSGAALLKTGFSIPGSFGINYIPITFSQASTFCLTFGESSTDLDYYVNLIFLDDPTTDNLIPMYQCQGSKMFNIQSPRNAVLIIARLDSKDINSISNYSISIIPDVPPTVLKADFECEGNKNNAFEINSPIDFFDLSNPGSTPITSYLWSFPGGIPSMSTAINPTNITYQNAGYYSVSLTVQNSTDHNTKTINSYLTIFDPGNGNPNPLVFTGMGPYISEVNQNLSFSINISSGIPQFNISFDFGDGATFNSQNQEDLYYSAYHSYTQEGTYTVTYTVLDGQGNTNVKTSQISIGTPGNQDVYFTYSPSDPGKQIPVNFSDMSSGGCKPYTRWQWIFGDELLTGQHPNPPWRTIYNYPSPDPTISGDAGTVIFPEYGTYPVTLIVDDYLSFSRQITFNVVVKPVTKCLDITQEWIESDDVHSAYRVKDNIYKLDLSDPGAICYMDNMWYYNTPEKDYCTTHYAYSFENCDQCAISEVKWSFKDFNNNTITSKNQSLPNGYSQGWWTWWRGQIGNWYVHPQPTQKGLYKCFLEVWNRISQPGGGTPATSGNYHMYDALITNWFAFDFDEITDIEVDQPIGIHPKDYSGTYIFAQTNPVNIYSGTEVAYESMNEQTFYPGFSALLGSSFHATADNPLANKLRENFPDLISEELDEDFKVYPNPSLGRFWIKGCQENLTINSISICNNMGIPVNYHITISDNMASVFMTNIIPGMYYISIYTNEKNIIHKKIILL